MSADLQSAAALAYLGDMGAHFVLVRNDGTPESKRPRAGITWGDTWPSAADILHETTTDAGALLPFGVVPGSIGLAVLDVDNDAGTKDFPSPERVNTLIRRFPPAAILRSLSGKPHLWYHDLAPLHQRLGQPFRVGSPFLLDGLSGEVRGSRTFAIVTDVVSLVAQLRAERGLRNFLPVAAACRREDGGYVFPEEALAVDGVQSSGLTAAPPRAFFGGDNRDATTTPPSSQALPGRSSLSPGNSAEEQPGCEEQGVTGGESSSVRETAGGEDVGLRAEFLSGKWYVPSMAEGGRHTQLMRVLGSVWAQPSVSGQRRPLLDFARWVNRSAVVPPLPDADIRQMVQTIITKADADPEAQYRLFVNRERIRGLVSGMRRRMKAYAKARRPRLLFIERGRVSPASSRQAIGAAHSLSRASAYRYMGGAGPSSRSVMLKADRETAKALHELGISPEKLVAIRRKRVRALQAEGFDVEGLAWSIGDVAKLLALHPATGGGSPDIASDHALLPHPHISGTQDAGRQAGSRAPPGRGERS